MTRKLADARLPAYLRPERYRLMIHPDFDSFTFHGEETIHLTLGRLTREIVLHAKEIKVHSAEFRHQSLHLEPRKILYNEKAETITFRFPKNLPEGKAELDLVFDGVLNDQMRGFYRSRYEVAGKERYLATTQFEATDARRAFPCVDEPSAKAVFDVTLAIPGQHTAISNTYETAIREHQSGYKLVQFAPTPRMSTYLLAFIVGEFEYVEGKTKEGITVRVFTTPGKKEQARFALEVAKKTLSFYSRYFGVKYPLKLLDMIAIPDFAAGAMENWGAVTYRESAILIDPEHSSTATKQWVALVVAHELAHQWFGNLVTMEWWTDLWLNEGFASWIEYLAVDHMFPEWDIWTQFVHQDLASAFHLDALAHTHPIEVPVRHPAEIGEIFDAVSYSKGASVIRMLADYLGERDFRRGLTHYLKRHQFANASTTDLWRAFEEISGKPVRRVMAGWTGKAGYPVITVTEKRSAYELRQHRFFASAISAGVSRDKTVWPIPVSFISSRERRPQKFLMEGKTRFLSRRSSDWIKLNAGAVGVYRIDYPVEMLKKFGGNLFGGALNPRDRFQIVSDAFAMAEAGRLPTTAALDLALRYRKETEYPVWAELAESIDRLDSLFAEEPFHPLFRSFARKVFADCAARLGWKKRRRERHTDMLLRSLALYHHGTYGDPETLKRAGALFARAAKGGRVDPDLRSLVYTLTAENGGREEFRKLLAMYRAASLQEEKNRLGRALGHFRDPALIAKTLQFAVSREVRSQDTIGIVNSAWSSPQGRNIAWDFVRNHWKVFLERYGRGGHLLPRVVQPIGSFHSSLRAREVERFFKTHEAPGAERTVRQVLERIRSNALWLSREKKAMPEWLRKHC